MSMPIPFSLGYSITYAIAHLPGSQLSQMVMDQFHNTHIMHQACSIELISNCCSSLIMGFLLVFLRTRKNVEVSHLVIQEDLFMAILEIPVS